MDITHDFALIFAALPACHVLLTPEFTIVAATNAYFEATHTTPAIVGHNLFEVFPENPQTVVTPGERNLSDSLCRVLETKQTQVMPLQRYNLEVPRAAGGSTFLERWWRVVNTPIIDEIGDVTYIINTVEDVTDMLRGFEDAEETFRRKQRVEEI
jgi:hypothetical protein